MLIQGTYDPDTYQTLLDQDIWSRSIEKLKKQASQIQKKYYLTTLDIDKLVIYKLILSQQQTIHDYVGKADYLFDCAILICQSQPKTADRYQRVIKILYEAASLQTPDWFFKAKLYLLKITLCPTIYGFDNELIQWETACYAFDALVGTAPNDLVIATRDWIQFVIKQVDVNVPKQAIQVTHKLLDYVAQFNLAPQYIGQNFFLHGYMHHYYEKKNDSHFKKAVDHYEKSLKSGEQNYGLTPALEYGKYRAMFHYPKLLRHPQVYGFNESLSNLKRAQQVENMKKQVLLNGKADYMKQLKRYLGYEGNLTNTSRYLNQRMGQSDNLDQNYERAMILINQAPQNIKSRIDLAYQFEYCKAWLYLYKSHLFQNPYDNAVVAISASIKHYFDFLGGKAQDFDKTILQMAIKILYNLNCKNSSHLKSLNQKINKIKKQFSQNTASIIEIYTTIYNVAQTKVKFQSDSLLIQIVQKSIDSHKQLTPEIKTEAQMINLRAKLIQQLTENQNQEICQTNYSYLSGYLQTCEGEYFSASVIEAGKVKLQNQNDITSLLSFGAGFIPYVGDYISKSIDIISSTWIESQLKQHGKNIQNIGASSLIFLLIMELCILKHIQEKQKQIYDYKEKKSACRQYFESIKKYLNKKKIKIPDNIEQFFLENTNNPFNSVWPKIRNKINEHSKKRKVQIISERRLSDAKKSIKGRNTCNEQYRI